MMMTPAGYTWTLGYDTMGRLVRLTSPIVGQAGYTPAYTTTISYSASPSCLDTYPLLRCLCKC